MQIGFLPLLFLIFLTLKLTGVIAWSWWLVFSPFIAIAVIAVLAVSFYLWLSD